MLTLARFEVPANPLPLLLLLLLLPVLAFRSFWFGKKMEYLDRGWNKQSWKREVSVGA